MPELATPLALHRERSLANDALDGLTRPFKELSPKYLYDARGSRLFDAITGQPEYYPTRAELEILRRRAAEIIALTGAGELVELGAGASLKARVLLDAMRDAGTLRRYVALDVSGTVVQAAAGSLGADYPDLELRGVVGDLEADLGLVPRTGTTPRLVALLGGTIGNFPPGTRRTVLGKISGLLGAGDHLLLGADFPVENFTHVAFYDRAHEWIEMRLRAQRPCSVHLAGIDLRVEFAAGEELRTEISAKFTRARVDEDLAACDLRLRRWLTDERGRFAVSLSALA